MTFGVEPWATFGADFVALGAQHWEEMPFDRAKPLCVAMEMYERADAGGMLHCLAARDDGQLVGYFVAFVSRHPHYDLKVGAMDVYFLHPDYRRGTNGLDLFAEFERTIKERGVTYLTATARLDRHYSGLIFERLGWKAVREVYEKRI